jgi:hypothetical protein
MALTTYSELVSAVSSWMRGRSDISTVIPDFIALFEATANRVLRVRAMETSGTITMSSGVGTLPTDYLAWKRMTWPGDTVMQLEYVHPDWRRAAYPTQPAGVPKVFTIEGTSIITSPYDSDNTSLNFLYYAKVPALTASATTNWLMTAHPDLYLYGTLVEANAWDLNAEHAALWKARRDELFGELMRLDLHTRGPSAPRIMGTVV